MATHSSRLPRLVDRTKDLDSTLRISPQLIATESDPSTHWESWGNESTIELCVVELKGVHGRSLSKYQTQARNDDAQMAVCVGLSSQPLPAINLFKNTLAHMSFMCEAPVMHKLSRDGIDTKGRAFLCASVLNLPDCKQEHNDSCIKRSKILLTRRINAKLAVDTPFPVQFPVECGSKHLGKSGFLLRWCWILIFRRR